MTFAKVIIDHQTSHLFRERVRENLGEKFSAYYVSIFLDERNDRTLVDLVVDVPLDVVRKIGAATLSSIICRAIGDAAESFHV